MTTESTEEKTESAEEKTESAEEKTEFAEEKTETTAEKKTKSIQAVYDTEDINKVVGAFITFEDDTTEMVTDLSDSRLKTSILSNFFVRGFKEPGGDDDFFTFELSPVETDGTEQNITVRVPIYKHRGTDDEPDIMNPKYQEIKDVITKQKHKFVKLKLLRELGASHCHVVSVVSVPNSEPVSVSLVNTKDFRKTNPADVSAIPVNTEEIYVKTDSAHGKDFTFTATLETDCDTHGQWRVAESHLSTLRHLSDPKLFDMFQQNSVDASKSCMRLFLAEVFNVANKTKSKAEQEDTEKKINDIVNQYDMTLPNLIPDPNNLETMLSGTELHCTAAENNLGHKAENIIYDLDKPFKEQLTGLEDLSFLRSPGDINNDVKRYSLYSQMFNYANQMTLKARFVENCKTNAVFQRSESELLEVMPITNPNRTKEEKSLLNVEYAQMIGNHVIAAQMHHLGCKPNQSMRSLEEGGSADVFLKSLDYDTIDKTLSYDDFNKKLMEHTRGILIRNKHDISEVVEHECYAPGKSPKAKQEAALGMVDDRVSTMSIVGGAVGATADSFVGDIENISVFGGSR